MYSSTHFFCNLFWHLLLLNLQNSSESSLGLIFPALSPQLLNFLHLKTTNARPGQWLTFSVTSGKPKSASNEEILRKRFGLG
jgi:hypothetical protein